ncbi:MAG: AmmeMemoRadiSam system radical SAM enzyme [Methanobacteriaceae archaeon]|nr:AmmeMemoRadiSam system radical SAM enzyme [Methanobacteriaceae archaeon]
MLKNTCNICSRGCNLNKGSFCGKYKLNNDGEIESTTKDILVSGISVDPIEKKPLYNYKPGTNTLSLGSTNCNFECIHCQNHEIAQPDTSISLTKITIEEIITACKNNNCESIAWTYNEPTLLLPQAIETAKQAQIHDLKTIFVTNGYQTISSIDKMKGYVDAVNIDIKSMSNKFYKNICKARLKPVLQATEEFVKSDIHTEITNLLIPGYNDKPKNIRKLAQFIHSLSKDIPLHLTRFYPNYKLLDAPITPIETLNQAYDICKEEGLKYVYLGNIKSDKINTYCPNCNSLVIYRQDGIKLFYDKKENICLNCGYKINIK